MRNVPLIAIAVALLLPCQLFAADLTPESRQLWNAYAALLEHQLVVAKPDIDPDKQAFIAVDDDQLDRLEAQYAGTSAYWELRYWNSLAQSKDDYATGVEWLRKGHQRGVLSFDGRWYLYLAEVAAQGDSLEARRTLANALVAELPDYSWPAYESALTECEAGDWQAGFTELERGNSTGKNVYPLIFPWSEVWRAQAVDPESLYGHIPATGLVFDMAGSMLKLPNYVRQKKQVRQQVALWRNGADLRSYAAWHKYFLRRAYAQGQDNIIEQFVCIVYDHVMTEYLLAEAPQRLTAEQRSALLKERDRLAAIKDYYKENYEWPEKGLASKVAGIAGASSGNAFWYSDMLESQ